MTELTLTFDWDEGSQSVVTVPGGPGADPGAKQFPDLGRGDQFTLVLGSGWPPGVGFARIDFYDSEADRHIALPMPSCWDAGSGWHGAVNNTLRGDCAYRRHDGMTYFYKVWMIARGDPGASGPHWFCVRMSNGVVIPPEVINKAGSGGGEWIDDPPKSP